MRMRMDIRRYEDSDRNACRRLWGELTQRHRDIYDDPTIGGDSPEGYFDEHLAKVGPDQIWVAVVEGTVAGFFGMIVRDDEVELEPIVVDRIFRDRGIGGALVDRALTEAKKLNAKFFTVRPTARNVEAIRFFREKGFSRVGQIELFIDLSDKEWKGGIELHGMDFEY